MFAEGMLNTNFKNLSANQRRLKTRSYIFTISQEACFCQNSRLNAASVNALS